MEAEERARLGGFEIGPHETLPGGALLSLAPYVPNWEVLRQLDIRDSGWDWSASDESLNEE
jgi:hypothetical protein